MARHNYIVTWGFTLLVCATVSPSRTTAAEPKDAEPKDAEPKDAQEMTARIDARLAAGWVNQKIQPAPAADDAEFLRRAWLDLTGTIPPINEEGDDGDYGVRGFLADDRPDKRRRLIDFLLAKPQYANHFAVLWKNALLPADSNVQRFGGDAGFQSWLQGQFADNVPYNKMVSEIILAKGAANQPGPALYYTSLQLKPEDLASSTSRIFCGVKIECAQCHDHPFDKWTSRDFWGYAAFFARLQRQAGNQVQFQVNDVATGEVKIPETDEVVSPHFLGGIPSPDDERGRRVRFAEWLTSKENPYFAKAAVNRVWAVMFGRGLVDPVDDFGAHSPPSHPELLDELTVWFVANDYDVKGLVRMIANTQAYRRSSQIGAGEYDQPELFARMAIKRLTAEQLYECLETAMRRREAAGSQIPNQFFGNQERQAFLIKFRTSSQNATEYEAGIPQALTMMNGTLVRQATDLADSDLLVALRAPFFTNLERVETLFLSTLSRMPSEQEIAKIVPYVESGGATGDAHEALSDVLWSLLNSSEFVLNH